MNTTHKALLVFGLALSNALLACGGQVVVEGEAVQALGAPLCESCRGTATVEVAGLSWLRAEDPDLDIDLCVGLSCGQALIGVAPLPEGDYPDGCIAQGGEVGCCFSSPVETMPDCSAEPRGSVFVTMTLPLKVAPGTTLRVDATIETMQGQYLTDLHGDLTVESCGESCVTGATVIE